MISKTEALGLAGCLASAMAMAMAMACAPGERDEPDALERRLVALESELPGLLERTGVPGLSIAVVRDGEIAWTRGFGTRVAGSHSEAYDVDEESIFGAASLTKPVFSYAVMKVVDEGRLDLDRSLAEYLDYEDLAADERARKITTRMVLSHSTGLPNWRPGRWTDDPSPLATQFEPGSRFQYSGEGMIYLQRVVEHVTGQPLEDLLRETVFEPLGMTRSALVWEERFEERYALPHREDLTPLEDRRPEEALAAGTLHTTASDYARFLIAVLDGAGLAEGTLEEILTPQVEIRPGLGWGLGWGLEQGGAGDDGDVGDAAAGAADAAVPWAIWQWGHDPGGRAFALSIPEQRLGMVFFANSDNGMLLLRRIVEGTVGETSHPALDHLEYDSYDSPRRIVTLDLERTVREQGGAAAKARFVELRERYAEEKFEERMLNRLGYKLLRDDLVEEAIAVFELNVEAFPGASNPYDSLGEAFMIHGDVERAILNYERSLELDSENANAVEMLKKLSALAVSPDGEDHEDQR